MSCHELKLDRSFVMHLDGSERSSAIIKSTIDLAHTLGFKIVAEGVETEEALAMLANWTCDLAQGYHICRPKPADEYREWLTTRRTAQPPPCPEQPSVLPASGAHLINS